MKTLLEAILDQCEISAQDAKLSVRDIVIQECDDAVLIKQIKGYTIKSGRKVLGKGTSIDNAWEDAALNILNINI